MDPLSHALWGATIIRNRELLALVVGASILPDLGILPMVFEVLYTYYQDYRKGIRRSFRQLLTDWRKIKFGRLGVNFYLAFHSLFAWLLFSFILFAFTRNYLILSLAYLCHLLVDIPTHYAAKPFYPLSNLHLRGIYFLDNKWVVLVNFLLLGVTNFIIALFS